MFFFVIYRCYDEALANKTANEIREIYSSYENPSCTKYKGPDFIESRNGSEHCDRWIYEYDHGYKSMSSEVSRMHLKNHANILITFSKL